MPTVRDRPDFLVIGAMKCGTTTMYHDLLSHPDIFLPDKESNLLFSPSPAKAYAKVYRKVKSGQICGEVCPDYSKLPDLEDAVPNARALFTDTAPRMVYVVREPLSRTLSHHRFVSSRLDSRFPSMDSDINHCVRRHPELVNYSRYAMQLRPWIEAFGHHKLLVIRFEDYIQDRENTLTKLLAFLGASSAHLPGGQDSLKNSSASRPVLTPGWQSFIDTKLYRRMLRPLLSASLREGIRSRVLPKPVADWTLPTPETRQYILDQTREDTIELQAILELNSPLWGSTASETQNTDT
jgi:hypothetical protein